jgi:hypothetical protein
MIRIYKMENREFYFHIHIIFNDNLTGIFKSRYCDELS